MPQEMPVTEAAPDPSDPLDQQVARWAEAHPLAPAQVDCAIAVMLKILDGKCKMAALEKTVMARLYQQVRHRPSLHLGEAEHRLIATAREQEAAGLRELIYEKRVLAETLISRPVMKAFKAMIREQGLFAGLEGADGEDE